MQNDYVTREEFELSCDVITLLALSNRNLHKICLGLLLGMDQEVEISLRHSSENGFVKYKLEGSEDNRLKLAADELNEHYRAVEAATEFFKRYRDSGRMKNLQSVAEKEREGSDLPSRSVSPPEDDGTAGKGAKLTLKPPTKPEGGMEDIER
jgi:hypothetical protein